MSLYKTKDFDPNYQNYFEDQDISDRETANAEETLRHTELQAQFQRL